MPRLDADLRTRRRFDDPLELREVAGRFVVRPPGRRTLVGAALQLAHVGLRLAAHQSRALGQVDLDLEAAHGTSLDRPVGHARREPAGILQDEPHEVRALAELLYESSYLVRLVLQNSGWLPTSVTDRAVERSAVRGLEVELDLPEGARLVGGEAKTDVGQLKGRADKRSTTWWANDESTGDLAKLEWVVEAPAGTEIGVEARHPRAGTLRRRVKLS